MPNNFEAGPAMPAAEAVANPYNVPVAIELDCVDPGGGGAPMITISVFPLNPADGTLGDLIGRVVVDETITARLVNLGGHDIFRQINGYDCSKDGLEGSGTLVNPGSRWLLDICTTLIVGECPNGGPGTWTNAHPRHLKQLFQQITTEVLGPGNSLQEMVFERKISSTADPAMVATPLIYSIFLQESGTAGARLALPAYTNESTIWGIIAVLLAAQLADWGPGQGSPGHEFPKVGSLLTVKKGFFKLLGFEKCTPELTARTTGFDQYRYTLDTFTTYFKEILEAWPQQVNLPQPSQTFLDAVGLMRDGNPSGNTPPGFILEEDLGPGNPGLGLRTATNNDYKNTELNSLAPLLLAEGMGSLQEIMISDNIMLIQRFLVSFQNVLTKLLGDTNQSIFHFIFHNLLSSDQLGKFCIGKCLVEDIRRQINFRDATNDAAIGDDTPARPHPTNPYVGGGPIQSGGAQGWVDGVGLYNSQNDLMSTVDKTVKFRELACGLRVVYTSGGDGLITGTLYTPTVSSIQDVLTASLISEYDSVNKSIRTIKASITKMKLEKIYYKITTRKVMYRQFHGLQPASQGQLNGIFDDLLHWCDVFEGVVQVIKDRLEQKIGTTANPGPIDDLTKFQKAVRDDDWPSDEDRPEDTPLNLRAYILPPLITPLPNGQIGYIVLPQSDSIDVPVGFADLIKRLDDWQQANLPGGAERAGGGKKGESGVVTAPNTKQKSTNPVKRVPEAVKGKVEQMAMMDPLAAAFTKKNLQRNDRTISTLGIRNNPLSKTTEGMKRIAIWKEKKAEMGLGDSDGEDDDDDDTDDELEQDEETQVFDVEEEEEESKMELRAAGEEPSAGAMDGVVQPVAELRENFDTFNNLESNEKYLLYLIDIIVKEEHGRRENFTYDWDMNMIINILYNISIYYLEKYRDTPVTYTPIARSATEYNVKDEQYSFFRLKRAVIKATTIFFGPTEEEGGDLEQAGIRLEGELAATGRVELNADDMPTARNIDSGIVGGGEIGRRLYTEISRSVENRGWRGLMGGAPKLQPYSTNKVYKSTKKSLRKKNKKRKTNKKSKKKIIKKSPKYSKKKSFKKKSFKKSSKRNTLRKSKRKSKK